MKKKHHYIGYIKWVEILKWKRDEIKKGRTTKDKQFKLYSYGTARCNIDFKNFKKNEDHEFILWLVTVPKFGSYYAFPTIVGKLVIADIVDQKEDKDKLHLVPEYIKIRYDYEWEERRKKDPDCIEEKGKKKNGKSPKSKKKKIIDPKCIKKNWQYAILGDRDKCKYYPINFAYRELFDCFKGKEQKKIKRHVGEMKGKNQFSYIGKHFRQIRDIDNDNGESLEIYAKNVDKRKKVFISYCRKKGAGIVKKFVQKLAREKIGCWLDITMIPQHKDLDKDKSLEFFESELEREIKLCDGFIAIKRKDYMTRKWPRIEFCKARMERKERIQKGERELYIHNINLEKLFGKNDDELEGIFDQEIQTITKWLN